MMLCSICLNTKVEPVVRVLQAGRVERTFDSWLRAENWVLDQYRRALTTCTLMHVYSCPICLKEEVKYDALFANGTFVYSSHRDQSKILSAQSQRRS